MGIFYNRGQLPPSHSHMLYLVSFEPPWSPLSNEPTAIQPLPLLTLKHVALYATLSKSALFLNPISNAHFQTTTTLPILPLPRSFYHHSNRLDLLYPTVPLPPSHCHSPRHCHLFTLPLSLQVFFSTTFFVFFFKPPQHCQYCHGHTLTTTIRTASISSFQRSHYHPATATPHPTATHHSRGVNAKHFSPPHFFLKKKRPNSANTATATL
jgi:hypothetical protein